MSGGRGVLSLHYFRYRVSIFGCRWRLMRGRRCRRDGAGVVRAAPPPFQKRSRLTRADSQLKNRLVPAFRGGWRRTWRDGCRGLRARLSLRHRISCVRGVATVFCFRRGCYSRLRFVFRLCSASAHSAPNAAVSQNTGSPVFLSSLPGSMSPPSRLSPSHSV